MDVGVLGPLAVQVDGGPLRIGGARLRRLLVRLAVDADRAVSVDEVADAVWPDRLPDDPAHALQSLVSRLRRLLPRDAPIRSGPGGYTLALAPEAVDAIRFERQARDGRRVLADGDPVRAASLLRGALRLWRGAPLADAANARYAVAAAARLAELRLAATEDLLTADLTATPDRADLVPRLTELVAEHPLRERGHELLILALTGQGRRAEALARYAATRRTLADQLGTEPGPPLQAAYRAALRDGPAVRYGQPAAGDQPTTARDERAAPGERPAPPDERPAPGERPAPPDERPAPGERPAPPDERPAPQNTYPGPRPASTEQSTAAGRRATPGADRPAAGDGPPAPDATPSGSLDATPAAPGGTGPRAHPAPSGSGVPPHRGRRGNLRVPLIALVGRDGALAEVGRRYTDTRLVTLTGPGGVGKTRLAVAYASGLGDATPVWLVEFGAMSDPAEVPHAVTAALGLRATRPGGARAVDRLVEVLSVDAALLVFDNCEHLIDAIAQLAEELLGRCPGLRILATSREPLRLVGEALCPVPPLGVPAAGATPDAVRDSPAARLFAARAGAVRPGFTLTDDTATAVAEICRRLDGLPLAIELAAARLGALSAAQVAARLGDRFALLTRGSRTALPRHRTLRAVVAWSWDLLTPDERDAAERLAVFPGPIGVPAAARVCGLSPDAVLDLLSGLADRSLLQPVPGAEPRFVMLETIRQYGLGRLAEAGRTAAARAAYSGHFRDLAERAAAPLRGPGQLPWLARLIDDEPDLAAAAQRAAADGDANTAIRLGAALGQFWTMRGDHAAATRRLATALTPTPSGPDRHPATASEPAATDADRARPVEVGSSAHPPAANGTAARVPGGPVRLGPPEAVRAAAVWYLFNAVLAGDRGPRPSTVDAAWAGPNDPDGALLGALLALHDDDAAAGAERVDRHRGHPDPWVRAMLLLVRSMLAGNTGDMAAMRRELAGAVAAFRVVGERWGLATALTYQGLTDGTLGSFDTAAAALTEAIALLDEIRGDTTLQRVSLAQAHLHTGDLARARREMTDVVAAGRSAAGYQVIAHILLGNLARHDGDRDEARRQYAAARADLDRSPGHEPLFGAMLHAGIAHLRLDEDRPDAARRHLATAYGLAGPLRDLPVTAMVGVAAARFAWRHDAADEAAVLLGAAHALRGAADAFNPDVAVLAERLAATLGAAGYAAAYERGRALDRTAATGAIAAAATGEPG
ncbi:hypothetical protein Athai_14540 [Actinocatenispora thailandica]|uniref:Uncharacterized protein n=1 Tax=Actinocatenispora thailandica TaxID=227318 RepID=A0A7R7HVT0_9ACTN|nr:BTAD domain-containing putative transcriptional regulator [Actinocatenispora thailandica]BCJ33951.1 hypothetical protein Athai_14540 [Actinocatenispora thailandica]